MFYKQVKIACNDEPFNRQTNHTSINNIFRLSVHQNTHQVNTRGISMFLTFSTSWMFRCFAAMPNAIFQCQKQRLSHCLQELNVPSALLGFDKNGHFTWNWCPSGVRQVWVPMSKDLKASGKDLAPGLLAVAWCLYAKHTPRNLQHSIPMPLLKSALSVWFL